MARFNETELHALRTGLQEEVPPAQPEDTPPILYKYRYFDPRGRHLELLHANQLWFASARSFNDPFDSTLQYQFNDNPAGVRLKWAQDFMKKENPNLNRKECRDLARMRLREIDQTPGYFDQFRENYIETNYNKFGICCLAEIKDDLLMWAHYSDHHRGFCVGIDTEQLSEFQLSLGACRDNGF